VDVNDEGYQAPTIVPLGTLAELTAGSGTGVADLPDPSGAIAS